MVYRKDPVFNSIIKIIFAFLYIAILFMVLGMNTIYAAFFSALIVSCIYKMLLGEFRFKNPLEKDSFGTASYQEHLTSYLMDNKTKYDLFVRPNADEEIFVLANKFLIFNVDIANMDTLNMKITVLDKVNKTETIFQVKNKTNIVNSNFPRQKLFKIMQRIFNKMNYGWKAEGLIKFIKNNLKLTKYAQIKEKTREVSSIFLDINQASEAELTAIPGVTIAKAKHAIKVRNKQKLFLTMNQFYKAIDLNEEFIEQIKFKGTKILLNELPEYRRIELKEE